MTATARKIATEADQAAADAAAEARAEVLERAASEKTSPSRRSKLRRGSKAANENKPEWERFTVDIWITNLNTWEFGIYQRSRNRAKSRQFTKDMDLFADITGDSGSKEVLGYREDAWKSSEDNEKRLVFKLFTEKLGWLASMDMMLGRSLQQTIGARGIPIVTFSVNMADDDFITYIERSANKWPFLPDHYSFFLLDEKKNPQFYRLRRKFINLGGDYVLYNQKNEKVGLIDGKVFSIGGKWKGKVRADIADKRLLTVLKMFSGIIYFEREALWHMRTLYRKAKRGKIDPKLGHLEADLYMNPRRVR